VPKVGGAAAPSAPPVPTPMFIGLLFIVLFRRRYHWIFQWRRWARHFLGFSVFVESTIYGFISVGL